MAGVTRRGLLAAGAALPMAAGAQTARRPNVVMIVADDMGYADIACYGRPDLATPNIDRLAATGVRFTQAYANSPVCTASRVAIITGRYQCRLAVGLEEPIAPVTNPAVGLPPDHPTLPSLLKRAGYGTALVGKWHLGALPTFGPLQSGYDHFYGYRSGVIDYYRHTGTDGAADFWDDDRPSADAGYTTDLFGDRAIEVIDGYARAGQPFLLSLHFNAPHWPWEARGDTAESQRIGRALRDYDGGSQETYRRMIGAMDEQVGRVMQALADRGLAADTMVILTSDNGGERYADTWPFTGRKTELLEGGLRIPAIVSWPARIGAGQVSGQVTANMDWLPTILAACGAAADPAYPPDGMSLLPHLVDGAAPVERHLFWRYKSLWQRAARIGDLKYLKILDNTFLFDVVADPMERANLKDRRPEDYARLTAAWEAWNATMLPETAVSFTEDFDGAHYADHIGLRPSTLAPDPTLPGPGAGQPVAPLRP